MILPEKFAERMKSLLGAEFDDYLAALSNPVVKAIKVNTDKISVENFVKKCGFDVKLLDFAQDCFLVNSELKPGKKPFHHGGAFYVQEPGAMLPVIAADLKSTDKALDLCASPGGKTVQAAARVESLVSNEIDRKRAVTLAGNVERMGLENVIVTNNSPDELEKFYPEYFDAVIVDAPCSGEGMFRKEKLAVEEWSEGNVLGCRDRQRKILRSADKMLKKGGKLVYSTCTFSVEENEDNVAFLVRELGYELTAPSAAVLAYSTAGVEKEGLSSAFMRRVYPHKNVGEGQFFAVLKKTGGGVGSIRTEKEKKVVCREFEAFCKAFMTEKLDGILMGDSVIIRRNPYPLGLKPMTRGVKAGEMVGNRFVPHHNLFTAFGRSFKNVLEVDESGAERYLRGEELDCEFSGFCAVAYCGVILGGGKASGGKLKNHYPKGLRNC